MQSSYRWAAFLILLVAGRIGAAEELFPLGDPTPVLRVEPDGPRSMITALAFDVSGDAPTLYAAGFDKIVRVWVRQGGKFVLAPEVYRVPIGPGPAGVINALAVSPDGRWLAVAGFGTYRGGATFRFGGYLTPKAITQSQDMLLDQGTIYVFDTRTKRFVRGLRGHPGIVARLAFAPNAAGPPVLISAAIELGADKQLHGALRVWDLSKDKDAEIDNRTELANFAVGGSGAGPDLAVFRGRDAAKGLQVALAFHGDGVYMWDLRRPIFEERTTSLRQVNGAIFTSDGELYFGGWDATRDSGVLADFADTPSSIAFADRHVPQSLALIPGRRGGPDQIAALLYPRAKDGRYQLAIVPRGAEAPSRTLNLWPRNGPINQQFIAASADGRFLAVSNADTFAVHVWETAHLDRDAEVLRGVGRTMIGVAFVRKGDHRGLKLTPLGSADADRVFDITGHRLVGPTEAWKSDRPDQNDWSILPTKPERGAHYVIQRGEDKVSEVRLATNQFPTSEPELLPPRRGLPPLLAVGYLEGGVSYLSLYNVKTGAMVRSFFGHQDPVRGLAFASDGKSLASTADDQTVCVWSLQDLPEHVGKHGRIGGLLWQEKDGELLVFGVDSGTASDANAPVLLDKVQKGDRIDGLLGAKDELLRVRSTNELAEALGRLPPGRKVQLSLNRGKNSVELTMDQAIDVRTPLFSLFFTDSPAGRQEWVAWSPAGSFDVGDRARTERFLVWHENTNKADRPVERSPLEKHRKRLFRHGIFPYLLEAGEHDAGLEKWRNAVPKQPNLRIIPKGPGTEFAKADAAGLPLLRRMTGIEAQLLDPEFPLSRIARVAWQIDDGPVRPFQDNLDAGTWQADFSDRDLKRDVHTLRLLVTLNDDASTAYQQELKFRYAWAPPQVALSAPAMQRTEDKNFRIEGKITPGRDGDRWRATLLHRYFSGGKELVDSIKISAAEVKETIELHEGKNTFWLLAWNQGGTTDQPPEEVAESAPITVIFSPRPEKVILALTEFAPRGAAKRPLPAGDRPLVVHSRQVEVCGQVSSKDKLASVTMDDERAAGFREGAEMFNIRQQLSLKKGKNSFQFTAKSARGKVEGPISLVLIYQPELPTSFTLTEPADGTRLPASEPRRTRLRGKFHQDEPSRFHATFICGSKSVEAVIDQEAGTWEAVVDLQDGPNEIALTVEGLEEGPSQQRDDYAHLRLHYCRPPVIAKVEPSDKKPERPVVGLVVHVRSLKELPPTRLQLLVQSPKRPPDLPSVVEVRVEDKDREYLEAEREWLVKGIAVPLGEGQNDIEVVAFNEEGRSLRPGAVDQIEYVRPLPPAPKIDITEPANGAPALPRRKDLNVAFTVHVPEKTGKVKVALLLDEKQQELPKPVIAGEDRVYQLTVPQGRIDKPRREHWLEVQVEYGDGLRAPTAKRRFEVQGPRVELVASSWRLEELDPNGARMRELRPDRMKADEPVFGATVEWGLVSLRGELEWTEDKAADPGAGRVRIWVNDFEQFEEGVGEARGRRREVRIFLRLTQTGENRIRIRFPPALEMDDLSCTIRCLKPLHRQRLLLLVLAPEAKNQAALKLEVAQTFGAADLSDNDTFQPKAFESAQLFTLAGYFRNEDVEGALEKIKETGRAAAELASDPSNPEAIKDVVVIYFRGQDRISNEAQYLMTQQALRYEQRGERVKMQDEAINCNTLREGLEDFKGAKLLLVDSTFREQLDGAREFDPAQAFRDRWPRVGMLMRTWVSKEKNIPPGVLLLEALKESLRTWEVLKEVSEDLVRRREKLDDKIKEWLRQGEYISPGLEALRLSRKAP
jgi:WD40 repeat protein